MNDKLVSLFSSIHFETEMLEAHEWDEDACNETLKKLIEYFRITSKNDLDLIKIDLGLIFSEEIVIIVMSHVDSLSVKLLSDKIGKDYEA